ncbi:MAG TPA: 1-deoxy-D-xylulose-5-phosphate reductoisomerase [Proteobacteria bacterium]|nr:1-deoxy-D-xylulose-5-phosphate reductoisomerase [Pseudomonadota bacterium]
MRGVAIIGSTGSIGTQALDVVRANRDMFRITALAAHSNADLICRQAIEFEPELVVLYQPDAAARARKMLEGRGIEVLDGERGLIAAAQSDADVVLISLLGIIGLKPTLAAIERRRTVALATKEVIVSAGRLVIERVNSAHARLIPVDSEHSSLFQIIGGRDSSEIAGLILTASGGPFLNRPLSEFASITPEEALRHPSWSMGSKITVDSATLVNKGLEVIEARWFFDIDADGIEVVIHPQSIVHGMVRFTDGSVMAHLSYPDMRVPIAYALSCPQRLDGVVQAVDLSKVGSLEFLPVDHERFPALKLAYDALKSGDGACCALSAADEVAVEAFLNERIGFLDIAGILAEVLNRCRFGELTSTEEVLECDAWARRTASEIIKSRGG